MTVACIVGEVGIVRDDCKNLLSVFIPTIKLYDASFKLNGFLYVFMPSGVFSTKISGFYIEISSDEDEERIESFESIF